MRRQRDELSTALEHAVIFATKERTPRRCECVKILLDNGVTPGGIRFNMLCDEVCTGRAWSGPCLA